MSYVDSWYDTSDDDQKLLKAVCADPKCAHLRYQHGETKTVRNGYYRFIQMAETGKCTNCKCHIFWEEAPITSDDVLDVAVALRYDVRLDDIGIAPLSKVKCAQLTIRHTGAGQLVAGCSLEANHSGDHAPDWSDLHAAEGK